MTKMVIIKGRGQSGKTTLTRLLAERAAAGKREVSVADADMKNGMLKRYLKHGVVTPDDTDGLSLSQWLELLLTQAAKERVTLLVDLGSDDTVFSSLAEELDLANLLIDWEIEAALLVLCGPRPEDLVRLTEASQPKSFWPERRAIVWSEALDPRPREVAYRQVRSSEFVRGLVKAGAEEVWFPRLPSGCLDRVNEHELTFSAAAVPEDNPLLLTDQARVKGWRRAVERELAPIEGWLP